jgi:hypothetical protein
VGSVVGEDGVDLVTDGGYQAAQEVSRGTMSHLLMQLDEGELRRSVDGDEQVELALRSSNLGDVDIDMKLGLEFAFGGGFAFDLRQPGDLLALQTPVKGRARQMRDRGDETASANLDRAASLEEPGVQHAGA